MAKKGSKQVAREMLAKLKADAVSSLGVWIGLIIVGMEYGKQTDGDPCAEINLVAGSTMC